MLLGAGSAAISRYLMPNGPTTANPPHAAAAVDSWADERADTIPLYRPCHILCISNSDSTDGNVYTHARAPVYWPFFRDYPGEPVPER